MPPLSLCLADISTRSELVDKLGVDNKALDLVTLNSTPCKNDGCNLSAAANNNNQCVLCTQRWYPQQFNSDGTKNKYRRGYGLYGRQFMRIYNCSSPPKSCSCDAELCQEIGYSHDGMFCFPSDERKCKQAIRALGIQCPDRREAILGDPRHHYVAPWHFHRHHLSKNDNGRWAVRDMEQYFDTDGKAFDFPPPNGKPLQFIQDIILPMGHDTCRGGYDILPPWVKELAQQQQQQQQQSFSTPAPTNKVRRVIASISSAKSRLPRKRESPEKARIRELEASAKLLQAQLDSAFERIDFLESKVTVLDGDNIQLRIENTKLKKKVIKLEQKVKELEQRKCLMSYDELKPGGVLADYVNDFTFFPNFACNDAFLDLINYSDGLSAGKGICENMKRYHHMKVKDRVKYNDELREALRVRKDQSGVEDSRGDAGEDLDEIMAESMQVDDDGLDEAMADATIDGSPKAKKSRSRQLHWKTEYLVYCFFSRCNISMTRIAALFGIGRVLVHDIIYAWANMLCDTLAKAFPVPTRSQMLRAYPKSVIKKFGHAHIFMLLDATEIFAEVASMKTVNAILYSAYKHHSTLKWLVGCDPIGTVWDDSISDGYPGAISDPIQTIVTDILAQIPFGCALEVDKGFLIENECILLGIHCIRPMKMLKGQTQQSKEDVALTQKVGKTRIPVEQVNGQMKGSASFFDKKIRLDQIGLADLICRSSYLLQNFKRGFIQQHDGNIKQRPCKAEIRWHGGEDDGLFDVRPLVDLWGMESEINRWRELRHRPEHSDLSDTEISEIVLNEDWPSRLRKHHIAQL